jgi:hypothetical protein
MHPENIAAQQVITLMNRLRDPVLRLLALNLLRGLSTLDGRVLRLVDLPCCDRH